MLSHKTLRRYFAISVLAAVLFQFSDPSRALANGGLGLSMNGAVGATVINGVNYQFLSLRPDLSIGKFGIGLDLSLYFDADGNIRKEGWNKAADIVEKIYYVRWGQSGDPFYIRVGNLAPVTLGYGLIMRRYTNSIEWPSVRRVGMQMEVRTGGVGVETVVGNFREIKTPGLVAARVTYELDLVLPVQIGGIIAYDGNQFLGAKDEDNDGIPDRNDLFPGKDDEAFAQQIIGQVGVTNAERLVSIGAIPDIFNLPPSIQDLKDPVTIFGLDVGVPIIRTEKFNIWTYAQAAQIVDYGMGIAAPGVVFRMGPFHAGAEYRIFAKKFRGEYFDMSYETGRVIWDEVLDSLRTKESTLDSLPSAQGIWADAGMTFFGLLDIYGSFQNMSYDGGESTKSIYTSAGLKGGLIPKITVAEAYFQQPDAKKLFNTDSDGTVVGYKIGYEIGQGVSIIYDNKSIYHNGKPTKIMTIETALAF